MIRALAGADASAAARGFLAAAAAQPLPGVELSSAWYAFGKGQPTGAGGWHFFTAGPQEEPFALALRGGAAWACGIHDPDELGAFLRYVGAERLTARGAPAGFVPAERLLGYLLPYRAGQEPLPPPPGPAGYRLDGEPDTGQVAAFLRQQGAFALPAQEPLQAPFPAEGERVARTVKGVACPPQGAAAAGMPNPAALRAEQQEQEAAARRFAEELAARAAVGLGYAALLHEPAAGAQADRAGEPTWPASGSPAASSPETSASRAAAAMTLTTAPWAKEVCLSALQVRADLRGQGLGGWLVRTAAAQASRHARGLCLLCRPARAGFYEGLGFVPEGEYCCFVPAP